MGASFKREFGQVIIDPLKLRLLEVLAHDLVHVVAVVAAVLIDALERAHDDERVGLGVHFAPGATAWPGWVGKLGPTSIMPAMNGLSICQVVWSTLAVPSMRILLPGPAL